MELISKPRSFNVKKYICIACCTIGILILVGYAVLIGTNNIPDLEETDDDLQDSNKQEIINKVFDAIFHGLGIIGAATENKATMVTFLILTLITKYLAISEAIANYYFIPYAIWSVIVSITGSLFYRDLRRFIAISENQKRKCPYCPHCSNSIGFVPAVQPAQPGTYLSNNA